MANKARRTGTGKRVSRADAQAALRADAMATEVPSRCDVCVVGGGASGLACAIAAADAGARVVVLERDLECGRKILATGNGRCNLANLALSDAHAAARHYRNPQFVRRCCKDGFLSDIQRLFEDCGLLIGVDAYIEDGYRDFRLFPHSRQAASVRNALLKRARDLGVTLACCREATQVVPTGTQSLLVKYADPAGNAATIECAAVVVATGGGATRVLDAFGIPQVPTSPVLCPLACDMGPFAQLDGRKARVGATLTRGDETISHNHGEILFRSWGISGILAFDLSRKAQPGDIVWLDLVRGHLPMGGLAGPSGESGHGKTEACEGQDPGEKNRGSGDPSIHEIRMQRYSYLRPILDPDGTGELEPGSLDGLVDPVIAAVASELASKGWLPEGLPGRFSPNGAESAADAAIRLLTELPLRVTGTAKEELSQVTRGGLSTEAFDCTTLECLRAPGVFACGEALDVDGDCGGFNLGWAWKSGLVAGAAAASRALGADVSPDGNLPDDAREGGLA